MGLVLWIDQNTFATTLLEKVFKKRDLNFYTIKNATDFVYLVEDLRPSVLVLDVETALADVEKLRTQYQASVALRELPVIYVGGRVELDFIQDIRGVITRPFDPFKIPEMIKNIL